MFRTVFECILQYLNFRVLENNVSSFDSDFRTEKILHAYAVYTGVKGMHGVMQGVEDE